MNSTTSWLMLGQVSAIVTAHRRIEQTLATLARISECKPPPDEICVHVDDNQIQCASTIRVRFPEVQLIISPTSVGPGGGRNKLLATATHEFVASFDDDSYPIDDDFFARVHTLMEQFPEASIVSAAVYHQGETIQADDRRAEWVSDFGGGACVYRRSAFLRTAGYVPLPLAYGMEEVDLALRLNAQGGRILRTPWLRVFHDTDLKRHADARITEAGIANVALLVYLRYPPSQWLRGVAQCAKVVLWYIRHGRWRGLGRGLLGIPRHLSRYRAYRAIVPAETISSFMALRRDPTPAVPARYSNAASAQKSK